MSKVDYREVHEYIRQSNRELLLTGDTTSHDYDLLVDYIFDCVAHGDIFRAGDRGFLGLTAEEMAALYVNRCCEYSPRVEHFGPWLDGGYALEYMWTILSVSDILDIHRLLTRAKKAIEKLGFTCTFDLSAVVSSWEGLGFKISISGANSVKVFVKILSCFRPEALYVYCYSWDCVDIGYGKYSFGPSEYDVDKTAIFKMKMFAALTAWVDGLEAVDTDVLQYLLSMTQYAEW
jgi:hypothetical protein